LAFVLYAVEQIYVKRYLRVNIPLQYHKTTTGRK
jgi:hypothetical protein